ncbi:hypothetical protein, partial [Pseudomonas coronafaciens]
MARLNQRTALEAGNHHRGVIHLVMPSWGMGTHLRLVVSVILTVILLDHVIARQCSVLFYRKELIIAAESIT